LCRSIAIGTECQCGNYDVQWMMHGTYQMLTSDNIEQQYAITIKDFVFYSEVSPFPSIL